MPAYLDWVRFDWGWSALKEPERAIVRRYEAVAQAHPFHTLETLREELGRASRELRGRVIRARAEIDGDRHTLRAFDGRVQTSDTYDESGELKDALTAADHRAAGVTQIWTGLFWSPPILDAMTSRAAELDWSLSRLVEHAWKLGADLPAPATSPFGALDPLGHQKQSVFLTLETWSELQDRATRDDRSMSWLLRQAITAAWPALAALTR